LDVRSFLLEEKPLPAALPACWFREFSMNLNLDLRRGRNQSHGIEIFSDKIVRVPQSPVCRTRPHGGCRPDVLHKRRGMVIDGQDGILCPPADQRIDVPHPIVRSIAAVIKGGKVGQQGTDGSIGKDARDGPCHLPTCVYSMKATGASGIRLRAVDGYDAYVPLRPQGLFQEALEAAAEHGVVLKHEIRIGRGMSLHQLRKTEEPIGPGREWAVTPRCSGPGCEKKTGSPSGA